MDRKFPLNVVPSSCFRTRETMLFLCPHDGDPLKATSCVANLVLALGRHR